MLPRPTPRPVMFARGFATRTRIIIVMGALYILSSVAMVGGMIIAPSQTADFFPAWLAVGGMIFLSVIATYCVLAYREWRDNRKAAQIK